MMSAFLEKIRTHQFFGEKLFRLLDEISEALAA